MSDSKPIRNNAEYEAALLEVERLWGAKLGTSDGDRLNMLTTLISAYEDEHFPMGRRSSKLEGAIEALYTEFCVSKPQTIEGCPCCTDPKEVCTLLAKGLRELTPDELSNYGCSLFLTMGDERDFPYFVPRLLDIATSQDWVPSPEVLLDKLKRANWHAWPKRRQKAVRKVIDLWFTDTLAGIEALSAEQQYTTGSPIDALLCGIANSGLSLKPFLGELAKHPVALKACFDWHAQAFFKRRGLGEGFWTDCPEGEAEVVAFYELPSIRERLGF